MKITTFTNSNNSNNSFFRTNDTNYSALLDAIISSNIKKTNTYLNGNNSNENELLEAMINEAKLKKAIDFGKALKGNNLIAAAKFLASYNTKKYDKLPYQFGHIYYIGGTPIIFHYDSIEIGGEEFYYDEFNNLSTMNLSNKNKKLIIDIYTNSDITIDINL
jgi:hypothetical protein